MNSQTSLEDLLKAGAHFGHKAARWNPKMAPYIFTVRNKFHIIDLEKTRDALIAAQKFVADTVKAGGTVLFVGTKRQARAAVKQYAQACNMPFVVTRWLGGTLTNFRTIQRSIRKMSKLEEILGGPQASRYTKKERLMMQREYAKSTILFEGLRNMKKIPEAVFVVDTISDVIAVREARAMKVKVIGTLDTNSEPALVDYPIPANDDAIKSIELITKAIAEAVKEGRGEPQAAPEQKN